MRGVGESLRKLFYEEFTKFTPKKAGLGEKALANIAL